MAIINSITIGKGKKSLGNVTLQHYYNKTVAKQKILANPAYVPSTLQKTQRTRFRIPGIIAAGYNPAIKSAFSRTQYGSSFNNFVKQNYKQIVNAFASEESMYNNVLPDAGQLGMTVVNMDTINQQLISLASTPSTSLVYPTAPQSLYVSYGRSAVAHFNPVFSSSTSDDLVLLSTTPRFTVLDNGYKSVSARYLCVVSPTSDATTLSQDNDLATFLSPEVSLKLVQEEGNAAYWQSDVDSNLHFTIPQRLLAFSGDQVNQMEAYIYIFGFIKIDGNPITQAFPTTYMSEKLTSLSSLTSLSNTISNTNPSQALPLAYLFYLGNS